MAQNGQISRFFLKMTIFNFPTLYLEVLSTIPDHCGVVGCAVEKAFQRPPSGPDWFSMLRTIYQDSMTDFSQNGPKIG